MSPLASYSIAVAVLIILALLVVFNFMRYRFKGDKTPLFIGIFVILFVATIATTLSLLSQDVSIPL